MKNCMHAATMLLLLAAVLLIGLTFIISIVSEVSKPSSVSPTVSPVPAVTSGSCSSGFDFTGEHLQINCSVAHIRFQTRGRIISDLPVEVGTLGGYITEDLGIYGPGSQITVHPAQLSIQPVMFFSPGMGFGVGSLDQDSSKPDSTIDVVLMVPPGYEGGVKLIKSNEEIQVAIPSSIFWQYLPFQEITSFDWTD